MTGDGERLPRDAVLCESVKALDAARKKLPAHAFPDGAGRLRHPLHPVTWMASTTYKPWAKSRGGFNGTRFGSKNPVGRSIHVHGVQELGLNRAPCGPTSSRSSTKPGQAGRAPLLDKIGKRPVGSEAKRWGPDAPSSRVQSHRPWRATLLVFYQRYTLAAEALQGRRRTECGGDLKP